MEENYELLLNSMEILETKPLSDLLSEVVIKVCYVGDQPNNNETVITKEVGKQIAATLPGAPIAGFFNKTTGDFEQHNRKVSFEKGEIIFEDTTKAYGFVDPVSQPWYQIFDEDGQIRTYLMCKGYLWTRQYAEAKLAAEGRGQSMELDEDAISGVFSGDVFIFTETSLLKLCILGNNFQPCFEGASIKSLFTKYNDEYRDAASELNKALSKNYYVLDNKLIQKRQEASKIKDKHGNEIRTNFTLDLGYDLSSTVETLLEARGMTYDLYQIEGIYRADSGDLYVILLNKTNAAYERIGITVNSDSTIELDSLVIEVEKTWNVKGPNYESPIIPELPGPVVAFSATSDPPDPTGDIPAVEPPTTVFAEGETIPVVEASATEPVPPVTEPESEFVLEPDLTPAVEPVAVEPEVPAEPPAAEFTAEPEVIAEPSATEVPADPPAAEFTAEPEVPVEPPAAEFTADPETTVVSQDPVDPVSTLPTDFTSVQDVEEVTKVFTEKISELEAKISEYEVKISEYAAIQAEDLKVKKTDLIASFTSLTEEETQDVRDNINSYSLDEIDAKLSILFAHKEKEKQNAPAAVFTAKINNEDTSSTLPEFMKLAKEYDESRKVNISLD